MRVVLTSRFVETDVRRLTLAEVEVEPEIEEWRSGFRFLIHRPPRGYVAGESGFGAGSIRLA